MNPILLLSITILCCCTLAEALTCRACRRYEKGVGCKTRESTCVPRKGYKCRTVINHKDELEGFVTKGCTRPISPCGTTQLINELGTVRTECCDDRDFCNDE